MAFLDADLFRARVVKPSGDGNERILRAGA